MKRLNFGLALTAAILGSSAGAADRADSSVPGGARQAPSLDSTIRRTVDEFVAAYANRNPAGLARVTTGDVEFRFELARTGAHVIIDEDALVDSWRDAGVTSRARDERSEVAIFPTADTHVMFVTYRIPGNAGSERIALLELRGNKIARAQEFLAPSQTSPELSARTKKVGILAAERIAPGRR